MQVAQARMWGRSGTWLSGAQGGRIGARAGEPEHRLGPGQRRECARAQQRAPQQAEAKAKKQASKAPGQKTSPQKDTESIKPKGPQS